ncbi:MAG: peptide chain release factor N(5)-glutamine methyltransferase, partial [Candidatus Omnitrophota bacterium]
VFTTLLGCRRHELYLRDCPLEDKYKREAGRILSLRRQGIPLQYLLGQTEFMGLKFNLRPGVFIPRPETEILVEAAIAAADNIAPVRGRNIRILDIGSGSGCISISLAKFFPRAKVTAVDISPAAIEISRENAALNNVCVNFIQGDFFSWEDGAQGAGYDLVVSNPPYIPAGEIGRLPADVRREPRLALDGGEDGLDFYRKIAYFVARYGHAGVILLMEMGQGQRRAIEDIAKKCGLYPRAVIKDYNGIDRVVALGSGI